MSTIQCEDDIYRGEEEQHHLYNQSAQSLSSAHSSSSSSAAGGRIGAIAAKLELAIARWAKNVRRNSSSSSTSSASSVSSRTTLSKSQLSRKRRLSRAASLSSEHDIALRITRLKALREARQLSRAFSLYLPSSLIPELRLQSDLAPGSISNAIPHISSTTSLPVLLTQLTAVIRLSGRRRRQHHRIRGMKSSQRTSNPPLHPRLLSLDDSVPRSHLTTTRKGKQHENMIRPARLPEDPQVKPQAWFLDVSSPTWADLQAIGKLLHIHPLTLEDILHQDPREKVDDFPNLGYYFISFRTIESQKTKETAQREPDPFATTQDFDEGYIAETNVYLAVFIDGICCFHYTDASQHLDRVRSMMEKNVNTTSDWIAHTILDSIVDSIFPILDDIDQEIRAIDRIIFPDPTNQPPHDIKNDTNDTKIPFSIGSADLEPKKAFEIEVATSEKTIPTRIPSHRTHFASPRLSISLLFRRARRRLWRMFRRNADLPSATLGTLRRMARARKSIAVLGRLFGSKSDLMTGIKKRLLRSMESKSEGTVHRQTPEEIEIAMYMTDIQDHIFTLQLSLAHNERMLSHSHPAYMSNLRSELESTKSGIDVKVLYLTTATLICVCIQTITGVFSLNIHIPHNRRDPGGKYTGFSLVLAAAAVITISILLLVHHWSKKAERRRRASL